jgi:thioredoxin reductase (NADPH)
MVDLKRAEVVIVGAGPSGAAAAVQLKRYGIDPVIFESEAIGGLLRNANLVENYPGFPGGIPGPALVERIRTQVESAGVHPLSEEVLSVDYNGECFEVATGRRVVLADRVVIASGTQPIKISSLFISDSLKERVYYEVFPLINEAGKHVVIVGAGDAAFDYALSLAGKNNRITILNRGSQASCLPLLAQRAAENPHIQYLTGTVLTRVDEAGVPGRGAAYCSSYERVFRLEFDCLIFAIGRTPCLGFLSERLKQQSNALEASGKLYLIGDVKNDIFRQTAIAAGDGVLAAMQIFRKIRECTIEECIT